MREKKGIVLPLILILLVVLAMLGVFMNFSSVHEYRYTHRSADHLRAIYIAEAAIQATLAQIKENMNKDGELRTKFVEDAAAKDFLGYADLINPFKSSLDDMVSDLNDDDSGANVIDDGKYEVTKINTTLSDSLKVNDQGTAYGDRTRRLSITASIKYTGPGTKKYPFTKTVTQCFDVKVADVRPVGNKYVLMVADAAENDFNKKGDHFWVNNSSSGGDGEGISIGGKTVIDLYPFYDKHSEWNTAKGDKKSDLAKNKPNSPAALIPGWEADNTPNHESEFVADNEPWSDKFPDLSPKGSVNTDLSNLEGAVPNMSEPAKGSGSVHTTSTSDKALLPTSFGMQAGGSNLEGISQPCGLGINWPQGGFKHPLKSDKFFYNSGTEDGVTHLFFENCQSPCPIYGDVKKRYHVFSYTPDNTNAKDTGSNPCTCNNGPACLPNATPPTSCVAHFKEWGGMLKWDMNDKATFKDEGQKKAQYQVKSDKGWNKWVDKAKSIDCTLNFKSKKDFSADSKFISEDFVRGATRRVITLKNDKTLYDGSILIPEGIVESQKKETLDLKVNAPGCILTQDEIDLSKSSYSPAQNTFFAAPTALSLVTKGKATVSSDKNYAGICALKSIDGKIKLYGNLVTEKIYKDNISEYLYYDSTLRKLSDDDYGNTAAADACFVVTISPVPQEYFDHNSLE